MNHSANIISRLIALMLLVALFVLVWLAIISPARQWKMHALDQLSASQSEYTRLTASLQRLKAEQAQLSGNATLDTVWKAKRMGQATALVQSEISNIAAKHGVTLRSVTPMSAKDLPFTSGISFRVEGEATLDKLAAFLIELEGSTPALLVERAVLRRLNRPGRTAPQPDVFIQLNLIAPVALEEEEKT